MLTFQNRLEKDVWDNQVQIYETLKALINDSVKILDTTTILPEKAKPSFKTIALAVIICKRLSVPNKTNNIEMATTFDIKTATAIVQTYDGSHSNLNAFVDSANLLKELTKDDQLLLAIKF